MEEIAIEDVREGQVLAEDVTSGTGQVLLAAGTALRRSQVELLERRGVAALKIVSSDAVSSDVESSQDEGGETTEVPAPDEDEFADALRRLEHMFEGLDDDPVMRAIHVAARGMVESAMRDAKKSEKGEDQEPPAK